MIPYYLVLTKPHKQNIKLQYFNLISDSLENIKKELIRILQEEFSVHSIIPDNYDEFVSSCWFSEKSIDAEIFEYKIFYEGKWIAPWSIDELYNEVYDVLHKLELIGGYINEANGFYESDEEEEEKI